MRKLASIWFLLVASCVLSSCVQEEIGPNNSSQEEGIEKDIAISVTIPAAVQQPALRSIGNTEERAINTINILAFRVGDDGKEYYDYYAKVKKGANDSSFIVTVQEKANQQRFVIITNAGTKVTDLVNSGNWKGTEKNDLLSGLTVELCDKWNTVSASNYTAFPMWGESGKITIASTTVSVPKISLLRMIAKINVQLDESVSGLTGKFKLKSVRLYNTNTKGAIVPSVDPATGHVKTPTIPLNTAKRPAPESPLIYTDFTAPGKTDVAIRGSIYTLETAKATQPSDATCLVIGGLYDTETTESYYRVDFVDSNHQYLDILRNYQYVVNIVDVKAGGHDTPEEAFNGKSANMDATILNWNEGGIDDIIFDGQFFLSVSQNHFNFAREACSTKGDKNVLTVLTDYIATQNSGWSIVSIESLTTGIGTDWLTITNAKDPTKINLDVKGDPNIRENLILTYSENATNPLQDRSVKVTFAAGRLRYPVTITQNTLDGTGISLTMDGTGAVAPDTLVFNDNLAQHIIIDWTPNDENLVLYQTVLPGNYPYAHFSTNAIGVINGTNNHLRLAIVPPSSTVLPTPYVGYAKLVFTVSNGINTTEKEIVLKRVR
jgi:hypothetical protein